MLIVFRADADPAIGGGHLMRCLTLGIEMQQRGADIVFISNAEAADTVPALNRSGITCLVANHLDWSDAIVDGGIGGERVDLIVVDSYRLGEAFERSLRRHSCPILVINDAPRRHDCDLLLDMTPGRAAEDYAGLVPPHCRVLAGTSYTLLRDAFAELRDESLARRQATPELRSVFISLGLTDINGQTAAIARSLATSDRLERITVVTGPASPHLDEIGALASSRVSVHVDPPDIAELMASADIAVGTPGTSSWERCCLGLPSVLLVVAENQLENADALERAGAARVIPLHCDPPSAALDILRELSDAPDLLAQMSQRASQICDGGGASRVGSAIDELVLREATGRLTLRRATPDDKGRLWLWRNERGARLMFGDSTVVPWEEHVTWLAARLADPNTLIFIVEADGRPCGTVRFQAELTGTAVVSIAMARHVRGLGYGSAALTLACQEVFKLRFCERVEARVKRENVASQRIFLKGGFVLASEDAGYFVYHLLPQAGDDRVAAGHLR